MGPWHEHGKLLAVEPFGSLAIVKQHTKHYIFVWGQGEGLPHMQCLGPLY